MVEQYRVRLWSGRSEVQISGLSNYWTHCYQRLAIAVTFLRKELYCPGAMMRRWAPKTRYTLNTASIMKDFIKTAAVCRLNNRPVQDASRCTEIVDLQQFQRKTAYSRKFSDDVIYCANQSILDFLFLKKRNKQKVNTVVDIRKVRKNLISHTPITLVCCNNWW